ncbi:Protein of unknown function [Malonomonas rubra DSM 5091]|uniref:DUF1015 domain-containing protein n=1 Tax=Malonomonas rubra DSM 5091 TaxID=1122189 RepID=A0A1M6JAA3_MALRU|nr:DUF1015 domain-containing protein [Malonomonas rubra]SHJ43626.1 Protein of unknown function [Malonomonas rubra DSM 5091]
MNFEKIGLQVPKILLPKPGTDMQKWAVIACDQYTSDRTYWQRLEEQTKGSLSTLPLIFPEVYLEDDDAEARIKSINQQMDAYLADGSLVEQQEGFILIDRKTCEVESRKGLIVALDLDQYDYNKGAQSLIRATEGTILDRLPPRIKVRENAPIELPHIMVLIDDPQRTVIEPLFNEDLETVYDFELLENGGHLKGYRIDQPELINKIAAALENLADPGAYKAKYNVDDAVMLYAMGDGNHSFATAKAIWERLKEEAVDKEAIMQHPARYALVELVNVHDPGLEFEAIHRVLFNVDVEQLKAEMESFFAERGTPMTFTACADLAEAEAVADKANNAHAFPVVFSGQFGVCSVAKPEFTLVVATLQAFLDKFLAENSAAKVDYIHGTQPVTDLGSAADGAGFYLPSISKHDLFKTIVFDGALPRKTFSMGEADEKRFYLECRAIK